MTKPFELQRAEMISSLCERWGYTPQEALTAPVWVLRDTAILDHAHPQQDGQSD